MAYDHNLRQKKNAQKAAEDVFEPKSHRDERILLSHASKSTWLATLGILVAMAVVYWVVTHFGTKGLKSSQQAQPMVELVSEQDSNLESFDVVGDATVQSSSESVSDISSDNGLVHQQNTSANQDSHAAKQLNFEGDVSSSNLNDSEKASKEELETLQDAQIPAGEKSSAVIQRDSLPLPAEASSQAKMTFYEEMQQVEVPLDDAKKYPIQLEVPEYIVAGSFYRESDAQKELKRLSSYGQKLLLTESSGKGGRTVYILKTQAYDNRRELGARKNELRDLGARVRSYPVK